MTKTDALIYQILIKDKSKMYYPIQICSTDMSKRMTACITLEHDEQEALMKDMDKKHALELLNKRIGDKTMFVNKIAQVEYLPLSVAIHKGNGVINYAKKFITLSDMVWLVHFLINNVNYDFRDFQRFCPSIYNVVRKKTDISDGDIVTFLEAEQKANALMPEENISDELCVSEDGLCHLLVDIEPGQVYIGGEILMVDNELFDPGSVIIKDMERLRKILGASRPSGIFRSLVRLFDNGEVSLTFLQNFLDDNNIKYTYKI